MPRPTRSLLQRPHLTWRLTHPCAAYTDLEVWDTAELKQLESQMLEMEKSLSALRAKAVAENRPVRMHTPLPTCTVAWRGAWGCELRDCIAWRGVAWRLATCAGVARAPGGMRPPRRLARVGPGMRSPGARARAAAHQEECRAGDLPTPPISPHVSLYLRR